jgi:hypothetical protein
MNTPSLVAFALLRSAAPPSDATVVEPPSVVDDTAAAVVDTAAVLDSSATTTQATTTQATTTQATTTQATTTTPPATRDPRVTATLGAVPTVDGRDGRVNDTPAVAHPTAAVVVADGHDEHDGRAAADTQPDPPTSPTPPTPAPTAAADGVTFSGIPAVSYIADNGLGLGVVAAAYWGDGATLPYRTAVTLQLFATTRLVQDSHLTVDALNVADLPLRLGGRAGFLASLTQNYCGEGGDVTCDPAIARAAARDEGLVDDEGDVDDAFDRFVGRYYQRRFLNPYAFVNARYALVQRSTNQPTRVELTAGYRASYFIPGNAFADDDGDGAPDLSPYPGSLYAAAHPDGEPGLSSLVSLGFMLDSRDNEPAPSSGWWSEASVRATTPGSSWTYAGFNITLRGYAPVSFLGNDLGRRVVLAHRVLVDGIVGDAPVQDLSRLGGSQDTYAFGGADVGRGIRVQRYLGGLKVLDQAELRWRFAELQGLGQSFAFTAVGFVDSGLVGDRVIAPAHLGIAAGGGGALRVAWNENFIVRCDVAVSPVEGWQPQTYITVGQPF